MVRSSFVFSTIFFSLAAWAAADVITLHSGRTIEGRIIGGTANHLHIRVGNAAAGGVQVIDRADIAAVQRDKPQAQTRPSTSEVMGVKAPGKAPASRPAEPASEPSAELDLATHRALIIAIAKWRSQDYLGAGMDLSRLINSAKPAERQAMCAVARAGAHLSLAELAADSHLRSAIAARKGPAIRLSYVTEYEKPVLMPMLAAAYEAALLARDEKLAINIDGASASPSEPPPDRTAEQVSRPASDRPWYESYAQTQPASQPAPQRGDGRFAVIDWIEMPEAFEGSSAQAKALLPQVHQALSLLNERVRLDSSLRRDAHLKRQVLAERQRLVTLSRVLSSHTSGSAKVPPDPAAIAEQQARRQELQKLFQQQQEEQARYLEEMQEAARKSLEEQEKKKSFSLFDWLKPAEKDQPAARGAPPATGN